MSKPIAINEALFAREVLESSTPVLVDFWAPWCGPCRMVAPVLDALAARHGGKLKIVKINIDENRGVAAKLGVMSIPTLLLFKDGRPADRLVGYLPGPQLESRLLPQLG
ncbi:MAG TPA: thioredoxin [Oscillatoriaceae cyanobacterium]